MKKIIILIIISFFVSSCVFAAEKQNYNTELHLVNAMGIIQSGGMASAPITRAEAAVMLCRLLGLEFSNIKANPPFTDVPETHFAYGAIHLLAHEGIVSGTSENTYSPSAEITFDQFAKMLVASLNYEPLGLSKGYTQAAKDLRLFADGEEKQPMTKALAAHLICNAMNVNPLLFEKPFQSGYSILQQRNLTQAAGKIESVTSDYFILKLKSINIQTENAPYNRAIYSSDADYALTDTMKISISSALPSSMTGKECIAYIYSPFYLPQLKFIATDDSFAAMDVDEKKSDKVQTAQIEPPETLPFYDYFGGFSNGYAVIMRNGKYGAVDEKRNEVIKPEYDELGAFAENVFPVKKDGKMGYVDIKGKIVLPYAWAFCDSFTNGAAVVITTDGKYGLINKLGKYIITPAYDSIETLKNGLNIAIQNEKYGVIDNKGKTIIPLKYDKIDFLGSKVFSAILNEKTTYIKADGGSAFENKWDEITEFSDGYASVRIGGQWGAVNDKGALIINPQYEKPLQFKSGLAVAQKNGLQGAIDIKNNFVLPAKWNELAILDGCIRYKSRLTGLYGLMDNSGEIITEDLFKRIDYVSNNRVFGILYNGKVGFLDTDTTFKYSYTYKITRADDRGYIINNGENYGFMEW